jgi:hypothetical protein
MSTDPSGAEAAPVLAPASENEFIRIRGGILNSPSLVLIVMPDAAIEWADEAELAELDDVHPENARFRAAFDPFSERLFDVASGGDASLRDWSYFQWSEVMGQFFIPAQDVDEENVQFSEWLETNHFIGSGSQNDNGEYDALSSNFYRKLGEFIKFFYNRKKNATGDAKLGTFVIDFTLDWRLFWALREAGGDDLDVDLYNCAMNNGYLQGFEPVSLDTDFESNGPFNRRLKNPELLAESPTTRHWLHWLLSSGVGKRLEFENGTKFFDPARVHVIKMRGITRNSNFMAMARSWMSGRLSGSAGGCGLDKVFASTAKILIVGTGMLDPLFASVRANVDAAMANAEDRLPVHLLNPNIPRQCLSPVKRAELRLHQGVLTSLGARWPTPLAVEDIQRLYTR